jgi:DNA-binding transcriptional LysR family regulator
MSSLPDLAGLAIFAKVVEMRSFAGAAAELKLSKATVSKAISRVEARLGARLFNRTSRRLALTDAGRRLSERAARMLAEGVAAESDALSQSAVPRGKVRLAVPMSFGLREIAPVLPDFLKLYPDVTVDVHLSDAMVDLIGEGFDAAIRVAALPDSSLIARRLRKVSYCVASTPRYWNEHGRPTHPQQLAEHRCLAYSYLLTPGFWRFANRAGEEAVVRFDGRLHANNGDALMPSLLAGLGFVVLPDFILEDALAAGRLEAVLPDWFLPPGDLYLVMPPGGPRPLRVEKLIDFLVARLARTSRRPENPKGPSPFS